MYSSSYVSMRDYELHFMSLFLIMWAVGLHWLDLATYALISTFVWYGPYTRNLSTSMRYVWSLAGLCLMYFLSVYVLVHFRAQPSPLDALRTKKHV